MKGMWTSVYFAPTTSDEAFDEPFALPQFESMTHRFKASGNGVYGLRKFSGGRRRAKHSPKSKRSFDRVTIRRTEEAVE